MTTAPKKAPAPSLFPIFLKLEGQPCLVVGAGDVAESKITGLLEAAAKVRVVAPEATPLVQSWAAAGQIVGNYFSSDGAEHGFLATPKQM